MTANAFYMHPDTARALLAESRNLRARNLEARAEKEAKAELEKAMDMSKLEFWDAPSGTHVVEVSRDRSVKSVGILWSKP